MKKLNLMLIIALAAIINSYSGPVITDDLLDGNVVLIHHYIILNLYQQNTNNSTADLSKPIILAIHGYSATTFEWDEFRDYSVNANYRISQVLLGGHGRDYQI
jgi:carboxylesterase